MLSYQVEADATEWIFDGGSDEGGGAGIYRDQLRSVAPSSFILSEILRLIETNWRNVRVVFITKLFSFLSPVYIIRGMCMFSYKVVSDKVDFIDISKRSPTNCGMEIELFLGEIEYVDIQVFYWIINGIQLKSL